MGSVGPGVLIRTSSKYTSLFGIYSSSAFLYMYDIVCLSLRISEHDFPDATGTAGHIRRPANKPAILDSRC